jgi:hypothetical protein
VSKEAWYFWAGVAVTTLVTIAISIATIWYQGTVLAFRQKLLTNRAERKAAWKRYASDAAKDLRSNPGLRFLMVRVTILISFCYIFTASLLMALLSKAILVPFPGQDQATTHFDEIVAPWLFTCATLVSCAGGALMFWFARLTVALRAADKELGGGDADPAPAEEQQSS